MRPAHFRLKVVRGSENYMHTQHLGPPGKGGNHVPLVEIAREEEEEEGGDRHESKRTHIL